MDDILKQGITTFIAGIMYSLVWTVLIVMILLHINATMWMWIVFVVTVPLRIITEITSRKVIAKFREEQSLVKP